jgi:hypothetical protein
VLVLADPIVRGNHLHIHLPLSKYFGSIPAPLIFLAFLSSSHDRDEFGVVLGVGTGLDL